MGENDTLKPSGGLHLSIKHGLYTCTPGKYNLYGFQSWYALPALYITNVLQHPKS